jgi:hypothetical protein
VSVKELLEAIRVGRDDSSFLHRRHVVMIVMMRCASCSRIVVWVVVVVVVVVVAYSWNLNGGVKQPTLGSYLPYRNGGSPFLESQKKPGSDRVIHVTPSDTSAEMRSAKKKIWLKIERTRILLIYSIIICIHDKARRQVTCTTCPRNSQVTGPPWRVTKVSRSQSLLQRQNMEGVHAFFTKQSPLDIHPPCHGTCSFWHV